MPGCAAPQPVPAEYDNPVFAGLKAVCGQQRRAGRAELERLDYIAKQEGRLTVSGAPQGYDAYLAAEAARRRKRPGAVRGAGRCAGRCGRARPSASLRPSLTVLSFPAWDCLPYDRVSPKPDIESRAAGDPGGAGARCEHGPPSSSPPSTPLLQRVPPKTLIADASFAAKNGAEVDRDALVAFLAGNGYVRAGTVREPGDFALRGGIVDLWPPGRGTAAAAGFLRRDPGCHPPLRCRDPTVRQDSGGRRSRCCPPAKRR